MAQHKKQKIYKIISLTLLVSTLILIFYLSAQKAEDSSQSSGFLTRLLEKLLPFPVTDDSVRVFAHFAEYSFLAFLMSNTFTSFKGKPCSALSILLSCIYALSDEIHQYFVPGRACQLSDLIMDSVGIILGVFAFRLMFEAIKKLRKKRN
jgi:VanZ family protein